MHVYDIETTNTNNDLYDNAIPIAGTSATASGTNVNATTNTGGDDVFDYPVTDGKSTTAPKNAGGALVWWIWAAPTSGLTTIDTSGSNFDTLLTVFSYGHMIENDDAPGVSDGTSKVTFMAHAGLVCRICVQGYNAGTGNITLHVNEVAASTLQLGAAAYSVNENAGSITIPISRVGGSGAVSVQFSTSGGTATPNTDYVPITATRRPSRPSTILRATCPPRSTRRRSGSSWPSVAPTRRTTPHRGRSRSVGPG